MKKKILLAGGGGYIGNIIIKDLIKEYSIVCLDNFIYDHQATFKLQYDLDFKLVNSDILDESIYNSIFRDVDIVIILAGLVGDPITKKYPSLSQEINYNGLIKFIKNMNNRSIEKLIFISTCSNYGLMEEGKLAKETSALQPLSAYAKAKVACEEFIMSQKNNTDYSATILRFATAFGHSPRMRFDLTVNEFVRELKVNKNLLVYDPDTWRPYCHVSDFSRLIKKIIISKKSKVDYQIFNAGGDENNFTKRSLVKEINKYIPDITIKFKEHGVDPRNYRVDFSKVRNELDFQIQFTIGDGIKEILENINQGIYDNYDENKNLYGNYEISKKFLNE